MWHKKYKTREAGRKKCKVLEYVQVKLLSTQNRPLYKREVIGGLHNNHEAKFILNTQKKMRKESKQYKRKPLNRKGGERKEEQMGTMKTARRQLTKWHWVCTYLSVITLNELNIPVKDREWLSGLKKKKSICSL